MLCKSVKSCFLISVASFLFSPSSAQATLTVTSAPSNKGSTAGTTLGTGAFYATTDNGLNVPTAQIDTTDGFGLVDITSYLGSDSSNSLLYFDITTDSAKVLASGERLAVVVSVGDSLDATSQAFVPLAYPCGTGSAECLSGPSGSPQFTFGGTTVSRQYAVLLNARETKRIGFYPRELCTAALAQGRTITACDGSTGGDRTVLPQVTSGEYTKRVYLRFNLEVLPTNGSIEPVVWSSTASATLVESTAFFLNFQVSSPTTTCTLTTGSDVQYVPGDGLIQLDTSQLQFSAVDSFAAPKSAVLAAFVYRGTDTTLSLPTVQPYPGDAAFSSVMRVPSTGTQEFSPILNATDTNTAYYNMSILVRDAAGLFAQPPAGGCGNTRVQTTSISGFLTKNGCFIATATFGSEDAVPVKMLRDFRDEVLSRFSLGREFVQWYYSWSPSAADWLADRPLLRLPVLLLLVPLQVIAWFALNPLIWFLLLSMSAWVGFRFIQPWAQRSQT